MKIYTNVVIDIETGNVVDSTSFEYNGPLMQCISFGGGGEKSSSKPEKVNVWNPQQTKLFNELLAPYLTEGFGKSVPKYPGQMYVPATPEEQSYLARSSNIVGDIAASRSRIGQVPYTIDQGTIDKFYSDKIKAPMMQEWQDIVEPTIREAYVGSGYWGSARAQGTQDAAEKLALSLAGEKANLYYSEEQKRREAEEAALNRDAMYGMSAALHAEELAQREAKEQAEYSRQIEQEKVMSDFARWLSGETVDGVTPTQYNPFTQLLFQSLGLNQYVVGTSSKSSGMQAQVGFLSA